MADAVACALADAVVDAVAKGVRGSKSNCEKDSHEM